MTGTSADLKGRKSIRKSIWGFGAVVAFLAAKLKFVIVILKILKLSTLLSMLLSFGLYAMAYGWKFAAALVYLIFVHEMGHAWAARIKKIAVSPAIFIPFIGAQIALKESPKNARDEAFLAYGGPFLGLLSFLPAIPLYMTTHNPFWALVVTLGATINLFNLFPVHPLDGGRIASAISPKLWLAGLIGMGVYTYFHFNSILLLILILGAISLYKHWTREREFEKALVEVSHMEWAIQELKDFHTFDSYESKLAKATQWSRWSAANSIDLCHSKYKSKALKERSIQSRQTILDNLVFYSADKLRLMEEQLPDQPSPEPEYPDKLAESLEHIRRQVEQERNYYETPWRTRVLWLFLYVGLAAVLGWIHFYGMEWMHLYRLK